METLVAPAVTDLLAEERSLLQRLKTLLAEAATDADTVAQLDDLIEHLSELFLVVVVGEFNAGKSSLLNALFGAKLMAEGPTPTTAKITILRHGEQESERVRSPYLVERRHPAELLRYVSLVDTPGTNSIIQAHQEITENFIPRADLVLFVTSFDRPLAESERQFLTFIREAWGKRLVFVINKADLAKSEAILQEVIDHVRSGCEEVMDFSPQIFPVSAELAYAAKTAESEPVRETLWQQSRFAPLEQFITETLTGPERLALKLNAPLDAAERLLERLETRLATRRQVLSDDERHLGQVHQYLADGRTRMDESRQRYLTEIDNLLLQMEKRGVQFLDDTLRISKVSMLRDRDAFKEEFVRQVVRNTDRQIEDLVTAAVDQLLKHAMGVWNGVLALFSERQQVTAEAPVPGSFEYNRAEVFNALMREANRKIEAYDLREEARRILENAREAATLFQMTGAGALGLGVLSGALIVATALDAVGGFGLVTSGVLATVGLSVLPRQRRKAIAEFKNSVESLRTDLRTTLGAQFDEEIDGALGKVEQVIQPFEGYVTNAASALTEQENTATTLLADLAALRQRVHAEAGSSAV